MPYGGVKDSPTHEARTESSTISGKLRRFGLFILVSLPSLFMLLFTVDAALIAAADAFIFSLIQVIFIGVYFGYRSWKS